MKSYFLKISALFIVPVSISLAAGPCNNTTLNGRYALLAHGTQVMSPFNAVGTIIFDGNGHLTGSGSLIDAGGSVLEYQSRGTYFVRRDCSVMMGEALSSAGPDTQSGTLVNDGKKIFAIATEAGKNFSFIYEKQ